MADYAVQNLTTVECFKLMSKNLTTVEMGERKDHWRLGVMEGFQLKNLSACYMPILFLKYSTEHNSSSTLSFCKNFPEEKNQYFLESFLGLTCFLRKSPS